MEKKTKIVCVLSLSVLIIIGGVYGLFSATGKATENVENQFTIGAILPLSGNAAYYGEAAQKGINIARQRLEKEYPDIQIKIVYDDSQYTPKGGITAYHALRNNNELDAVITAASQVSLAIQPLTKEDNVLQMAIFASADKYSAPNDLTFRVSARNEIEAGELVKFINKKGYKTLGMLYLNNEFGKGFAETLKKRVNAASASKIIAEEPYLLETKDFRTALTKIKEENPDAIFMVGLASQYSIILKQAEEMGIEAQFLTMRSAEDPVLIENAGKLAEGLMYTYPFDAAKNNKNMREFTRSFKELYGTVPDAYAAEGYEGLKLTVLALIECNKEASCTWRYFGDLENYNSLFGDLSFDENGDVYYDFFMKTIKNGEFVPYNP